MLTTEVLASVAHHPMAAFFADTLDANATTLAEIASQIDAANDDDAPTFAASLAKFAKTNPVEAKVYDDMAAALKSLRAEIYLSVNGHSEKDSDRSVMIQAAKDSYYAARRMAVLIELQCEEKGFVNNYLGSLEIPEGSGLRKSMKVVK